MEKVLTIGIAAYNVANEISNCLKSLLLPEIINDIEILVINDGSTDNTSEVVSAFEEKYPSCIRLINKENGGHGSTINKTITEANGKFLKMVDADDAVEYEGIISLVSELKKSNADIVFSPYYRVNIKTGEKEEIGYIINDKVPYLNGVYSTLDEYSSKIKVAMHSITYRTSLLRQSKYRIDEHCFYVDVEYTIYYLLNAHNILMLSKPVYDYSIGSSEQSVNIDVMRKRRKQHLKVTKSLILFYEAEKDQMSVNMERLVKNNIVNMILSTEYKLLMSIQSTEQSYIELVDFDNYLRRASPNLYKAVVKLNRSKKLFLLSIFRKDNFVGYKLIHRMLRKNFTEKL